MKRKILKVIYNYLAFFLVVAFAVTCTTTLFVSTLAKNLNVSLTNENISTAAKLTFFNVLLLSVLFAAIDTLRRKFTTTRTTKHITAAAKRMVNGDFSVRIEKVSRMGTDENFNEIIDCFNTMAQELSSVETLRTDFISNVSHEMKTPLAAIQNYSVLLQDKDLSEEKRMEYAKAITHNTKKMSDMMTNILKLNRLENQQIYPKSDRYDLGEQLCENLLLYENVWDERQIEIEADIEEGVMIDSDEELLGLVWSNLLSNAFKFTPDGGKIRVSLKTEDQYAVVTVRDSGCGISASAGAHIFDKFYQEDTSHSTEGNGLGLALVKRVIDIVNGDILVDSEVGKGSSFTVKIRRD